MLFAARERQRACRRVGWPGLPPASVVGVLYLQFISITFATSLRHSEHKPTSNKSPALTAPEKLTIVTPWRHLPHQTLESNCFLLLLEMLAHILAAGAVNLWVDSMGISVRVHAFSQFLASLEVRHILARNLNFTARFGVAPFTRLFVI